MIKICLFEDDDTMRSLLKTLLEIEGFAVTSAMPEESNVEFLVKEKPDVLLLDVHLANLDGVSILKSIKAREKITSMLVLMTSGMDLRDICLQNGADGFLLKPYMPDDLINWIRNRIQSKF